MLMTRDRPCKARKVKCGEERPQCVKYNDLTSFFILPDVPWQVAQQPTDCTCKTKMRGTTSAY